MSLKKIFQIHGELGVSSESKRGSAFCALGVCERYMLDLGSLHCVNASGKHNINSKRW